MTASSQVGRRPALTRSRAGSIPASPARSRLYVLSAILLHTLALSAMSGCAGRTGRTILTSANAYAATNDTYAARCVAVYGDGCEPCYIALKRWRRALDDASAAYSRGGKLPSQLDALRAAQKHAEKSCR